MKSKNQVVLIGHLGNDPELKDLGGYKVAKFTIATQESYKDSSKKWYTNTEWHYVGAWGKKAEQVMKYAQKGVKMYLEGKLTHRDYIDSDGKKVFMTEVKLIDFMIMKKVESKLNEPNNESYEGEQEDDLPF